MGKLPLKIVIFNSYVSLQEGKCNVFFSLDFNPMLPMLLHMWFWNITWKICVFANLRHHLKKKIGCLGNKQMMAEDSTIKVPITSQFDPEFAFELTITGWWFQPSEKSEKY